MGGRGSIDQSLGLGGIPCGAFAIDDQLGGPLAGLLINRPPHFCTNRAPLCRRRTPENERVLVYLWTVQRIFKTMCLDVVPYVSDIASGYLRTARWVMPEEANSAAAPLRMS